MSAVWDPLSRNPYRILGISRDQAIPSEGQEGPIFQCPGLATLQSVPELVAEARQSLLSQQEGDFAYLTWFDASRPIDRAGYVDILEGRMHEAWERWQKDAQPLSAHNLAILAQLRWLYQVEEWPLARDCAQRWQELAQTQPEYQQVVRHWVQSLGQQSYHCLGQGDAKGLSRCWSLCEILMDPAQLECEQRELLVDELRRWDFELASLRQALLEDVHPATVNERFLGQTLPLAQLLLTALPTTCQTAKGVRTDLARFYISLARAWRRLPESNTHAWDASEQCLESALEQANLELALEIRVELDHWRLARQPREGKPVEVTFRQIEERPLRIWLGAAIVILSFVALIWAGFHQPKGPYLAGMTRPVAEKRVAQIVNEISPIASRLGQLSGQIANAPSLQQRQQLQQEQEALKRRHQSLKEELVRLQKWLESR